MYEPEKQLEETKTKIHRFYNFQDRVYCDFTV